jgi:hypothetical protein
MDRVTVQINGKAVNMPRSLAERLLDAQAAERRHFERTRPKGQAIATARQMADDRAIAWTLAGR